MTGDQQIFEWLFLSSKPRPVRRTTSGVGRLGRKEGVVKTEEKRGSEKEKMGNREKRGDKGKKEIKINYHRALSPRIPAGMQARNWATWT